jgi:hypothetical protein
MRPYLEKTYQEKWLGWALVAHACNPSFSRGRDQEDAVQSQPRQIVRKTLSRKNLSQKGLAEWLKVKTLNSSPVLLEKKKTKERKEKWLVEWFKM